VAQNITVPHGGQPWFPTGLPADAPAMVTQRTYKTDDEVHLKVAGGSNFLEVASADTAKITRPTHCDYGKIKEHCCACKSYGCGLYVEPAQ
jgi:hypothetical protein